MENTKPTTGQVAAFVARCQEMVDKHMAATYQNNPRRVLAFTTGQRYARVTCDRSAWAFVDLGNGDVLLPASYKSPAKHARGNILAPDGGMGNMGPYGPAYMR